MTIPLGLYGAARPVASGGGGSLVFRDSYEGANASSASFTMNIGPAHPDRVVIIAHYRFTNNTGLATLTLNGDAGTRDLAYTGALSNRHHIVVTRFAVPSGEVADLFMSTSPSNFTPQVVAYTSTDNLSVAYAGGTYSADGTPSLVTGHAQGRETIVIAGRYVSSTAGVDEDASLSIATFGRATSATVSAQASSAVSTGLGAVSYQIGAS